MKRFEWWFDFSCPYAYLSSKRVEDVAARTGAELDVRPMLLGGVFRARETPQKLFAALGPEKTRHNANDYRRWAAWSGTELRMPAEHPFRTVEALRSLLVVGPPYLPLIHAFYDAYWVRNVDIGAREGLASVLNEAGHDAEEILGKIQSPEVKADLRKRTDEAIERGIFGAPSFFVDGDLYYGQDRLRQVEAALGGTPAPIAPEGAKPVHPVEFWFDYSSPYAYLGALRAERLLGDHATWRPMLLGAVFKSVGTPMVPLFELSDAKRAYNGLDLARQAAEVGAEFSWPTRFPMNTVLALRVTLLAGRLDTVEGRRLVHRFFRAYWAEDRDLADPAVVAELASEVGVDGPALVKEASSPPAKQALRAWTDAAVEAGIFGAPAIVVKPAEGPAALYWGSDRVELAVAAACGRDELL